MNEQELQLLEYRLHNFKISNGKGDGGYVVLTPREFSRLVEANRQLNLCNASEMEYARVVKMLVASGYVTQDKVLEAFEIVHGFQIGPLEPATDTGD